MIPDPRGRGLVPAAPLAGRIAVRLSSRAPRSVTIHVRGEVDLHTAPDLTAVLSDGIRGPVDEVVVELSGVTFFGAAGLTCLLGAIRAADERQITVRVETGESAAVKRIFSLLRFMLPDALTCAV